MVIFKTLFKTLNEDASSFTITDEAISNNSIFEVYPSDDSVILADVEVSGTTANIIFDSAAEYNIPCAVFINNLVGAYDALPDATAHSGAVLSVNNQFKPYWKLLDANSIIYKEHSVKTALDALDTELHTNAVQGEVFYHAATGNEWRKLSGSDVDYDENTTINEKLEEVFQSVSNGKSIIASAITDKGVPTLATDTFQTMADHIAEIESGGSGGGQTYYKFYDPVGGTKVDTFTSTMNGTLKLIAVGYMNDFATIKINGNVIPPTESYFIRADYYYYVYVETSVNTDDIIEVSGTATGTSSFAILASIVGNGMDIADTTAIESDVASGKIFYKANGTRAVGTLEAAKVKNGTLTLTTADQTINCGFKPTQVCVCVGANRTNYFGFGINTNGTTVGSRIATSGSTSATSPATITLTDNGFKVKALSASYALASSYYAIG